MPSVFSSIIAGDIPGRFVWQDDDVVAFLTIAPVTPGHTLVVPRKEVDQWQDIDGDLFGKCAAVAQAIGRGVRKGWDSPRAGLLVAGIEVPHVHLHVFPAWDMSDFDITQADTDPSPDSMDAAADTLRSALRELGYGDNVPR